MNTSLNELDALFLTHGHNDHIARIKTMKDIESYGTFELEKTGHHIITTNESLVVKDLRITSIPLSHDFPNTVGYVVESETEKLVYITDTGYINEKYYELMSKADYYVFESNHDPKMLMNTSRSYYLKQRILSSTGHLSNQESSQALVNLMHEKTSQIVLAHLSQEANDESLALDTLYDAFKQRNWEQANKRITAARQFEILHGGKNK